MMNGRKSVHTSPLPLVYCKSFEVFATGSWPGFKFLPLAENYKSYKYDLYVDLCIRVYI